MNIVKWIEALRSNMKGLRNVLIAYLIAVIAFDIILPRDPHHAHYWIDFFRAYWGIFTVVGCFLLIKVGKGVAHLFLSKDTDYYG